MQFKVPKFLERETIIIGPLSFKQFLYFGAAALILVYIYYVASTIVFIIFLILLGGLAFSLAFIKVEGIPLPKVIVQSFGFVFSTKVYFWKRKENLRPIKLRSKEQEAKGGLETGKEKSLKVTPKSVLKKLHSKIEGGY